MTLLRHTAPMAGSGKKSAVIYLVDDDQAFLESVGWFLKSISHRVEMHSSPQSLLAASQDGALAGQGCIVADLRMPGMTGIELLKALRGRHNHLPFVVMTAYGDVESAVRALKAGAYDFIEKPFDNDAFADLVEKAVALSHEQANLSKNVEESRRKLASLTPREAEVLDHILAGVTNREMAEKLGISVKTIESHRARVMEKTEVKSLAALIHLVWQVRHLDP